jgi:hypothetical protein
MLVSTIVSSQSKSYPKAAGSPSCADLTLTGWHQAVTGPKKRRGDLGSNFGSNEQPVLDPKWLVSCAGSTKVYTATNQKVGSSNLSGRTIFPVYYQALSSVSGETVPLAAFPRCA